jgi:hypothetical protein
MDERMLIPLGLPEKVAAEEVMRCNEVTQRYGLTLTQTEATALAQMRSTALSRSGRVEFGCGTMQTLILAFCDSPYISRGDFADTMGELTRIFYDFKTDALDEVDDAETVALMRQIFDQWRGALDMVESRVEIMARNVRYGRDPEDDGEDEQPDEEEDADE